MSTITQTPRLIQPLSVPEAAEQRRFVRQYAPTPIPEADLREILRLVSLAPSAMNVQPWRFVVVQDPELKAQLREVSYNQGQITSAPAVIVLYTDMADMLATVDEVVHPALPADRREATKASLLATYGSQPEAEREAFGANQGNIALGFLMLVAQSFGYATVPMLGFEADKVKALLGLPAHVQIPAIVPIGVAAESGHPTHRHALERLVTFR